MKIKLKEITIRELTKGYENTADDRVIGFDGKLDIRPPYQREFVYKEKERDAVINSITNDFPLNVMYWAVRDDGKFEVIDGQQRTLSISKYVDGEFSIKIGNFSESRAFHNLQKEEKEQILDYKLMVYLCTGTDKERLEWFKIVNIAGLRLTDQELKNAAYSGPWVSNARKYFSKIGCAAHGLGGRYLSGRVDRQEYLETAIKWMTNGEIELYMSKHQHDTDALELWNYFQNVIDWVEKVFPKYRSKMEGVAWGTLYNELKKEKFDSAKIEALEAEVSKLMKDEYIKAKGGIYPFVLTRDDRYLNLRSFGDNIRTEVYEEQDRKCIKCEGEFDIEGMEADHVTPYSKGGQTTKDNCQMLCKDCNRRKSNK